MIRWIHHVLSIREVYLRFFIDQQKTFISVIYSGNRTLWQYGSNQSRSSLMIFAGSLPSNRTYEFKVDLTNIETPTTVFAGNLLVQIKDNTSFMIGIRYAILILIVCFIHLNRCIISNMCVADDEFQLINPTTQIALTSFCVDNCNNSSSKLLIKWNIFYGLMNLTNQIVEWTPYNNMSEHTNIWFFGE
jgi:hypothetical protein